MVLPSNPEVIAKGLNQASVLIDIPKSDIFELNETCTRRWELVGMVSRVEIAGLGAKLSSTND